MSLPTLRARFAFEWPDDVLCNPPAVEAAELRLDAFAIDVTAVHQVCVEGDVILNRPEGPSRSVIRQAAFSAVKSSTMTWK